MSASDIDEYCDSQYKSLSDETKYQDWDQRIRQWQSLEPKCGATTRYQLRLGALYTLANKDEQARETLNRGLRSKSAVEKELRLSLFDLDLRQVKLAEAESGALSLVRDFPDWQGGHRALGQIRMAQHRFEESVSELETANKLGAEAGTYILLTMAYFKVERYRDAVQSMQRALRMDRRKLAHTDGVIATVYSLMALGYVAEADDLLKRHAGVRPDAPQVPAYAKATQRVQAALAQINSSKTSK